MLVTGHGLGASHPGGFSEYARVPAAWVVPMSSGLTAKAAMAIGMAGIYRRVIRAPHGGERSEEGTRFRTGERRHRRRRKLGSIDAGEAGL